MSVSAMYATDCRSAPTHDGRRARFFWSGKSSRWRFQPGWCPTHRRASSHERQPQGHPCPGAHDVGQSERCGLDHARIRQSAAAIEPATRALCDLDFDEKSDPEQSSALARQPAACRLLRPRTAGRCGPRRDRHHRPHPRFGQIDPGQQSSCARSSAAILLLISAMDAWAIPWPAEVNKVHQHSVVSSSLS